MKTSLQKTLIIFTLLGITFQGSLAQTIDKIILQLSACVYADEYGKYSFKGEKVGESNCRIKISELKGGSMERSYEFAFKDLDAGNIKISKSATSNSYRMKVYTKNKAYKIKANIFGKDRRGNYLVVISSNEATIQQLRKTFVAAIKKYK